MISESNEQQALAVFAEKAYLEYAMYVILDRALPSLADGLKPVQRRLVYAMSELGLTAGAKYKKSARTIGDVLGKYHPHGDSACYEAMVLMAQPFSYRYPLVDGQGNWGSADDPKSFAAMRYTESRLTPYARALLQEIVQGTVNWVSNFDGTLKEPATLPARLPNILLNGANGIAVGMSTDIPPHNLCEIVAACQALLKNPDLSTQDLLDYVPAPDFPTGGELITPKHEIAAIYQQGSGTLRLRAKYIYEAGNIVIEQLPYQVSGARIQEQIARQIQEKKLPWLEDMRDESDHEQPTRLVLIPRSGRVDVERLMQHLFATTDLEKTIRVQLNMIGINGKPQVKSLKTILLEWLDYREQTVIQRLRYRLEAVNARLHVLAGMLITYLNLDAVIRIIREENEPKAILISTFSLSEIQAEAILNTRLRYLARLEEMKIQTEQAELLQEQKTINHHLTHRSERLSLIDEELGNDAKAYGDARRTTLIARELAQPLDVRDLLPSEPVTMILSKMGWIRTAKGHQVDGRTLSYKGEDNFLLQLLGRSNQQVLLLANNGRGYSIGLSGLRSARGYGEPLSSVFSLDAGSSIVSAVIINADANYVVASDSGCGFVVAGSELISKTKTGKQLIQPEKDGAALGIWAIKTHDELLAITNEGRIGLIAPDSLPRLSKGKGNQIIGIARKRYREGVRLLYLLALSKEDTAAIFSGRQKMYIRGKDKDEYRVERGSSGRWLPKGYRQVVQVECVRETSSADSTENSAKSAMIQESS